MDLYRRVIIEVYDGSDVVLLYLLEDCVGSCLECVLWLSVDQDCAPINLALQEKSEVRSEHRRN